MAAGEGGGIWLDNDGSGTVAAQGPDRGEGVASIEGAFGYDGRDILLAHGQGGAGALADEAPLQLGEDGPDSYRPTRKIRSCGGGRAPG